MSMRFIIQGRQAGTSYTTEASRLRSRKVLLRVKDPPFARSHIAHVGFIFERVADGYSDDGRFGAIGAHPFRAEHHAPHVQVTLQTSRPG